MLSASPGNSWRRPGGAGRLVALTIIVTVAGLLLHASPAAARHRHRRIALAPNVANGTSCLQDQFNADGFNQKLNCTANDVRVAKAVNVRKLDGTNLSTCVAGTTFNFIADFIVQTTSSETRSNIGLYMNLNGESALTATDSSCQNNIISFTHTCAGSSVFCGSAAYKELDDGAACTTSSCTPDNCGDTSSSDPTVCLNANNQVVSCPAPAGGSTFAGSQLVTVELDNFTCPSAGAQVALPNCTSWQTPGKTIQCYSDPNKNWPFVASAAIPGSPSKCNCESITLPITAVSYSITVTKDPSPAATPEPGGTFAYTVGVTNQTSTSFGAAGAVTIDQICDDQYGAIATVSICKGGTNAGGTCSTNADCPSGTCFTPAACLKPVLCGSQCTGVATPYACCTGAKAGCNADGDTCATVPASPGCSLPQTIAAGATVSGLCTFTGIFTGSEGSLIDKVTVSGLGATGSPASNSASATVTINETPAAATVTKSVDKHACATVRYNVDVNNTSVAGTDESESLSALGDDPYGDVTSSSNAAILGTTCGQTSGTGTLTGSSGGNGACTGAATPFACCTGANTGTCVGGALPASIPVGSHYVCQFDAQVCGTLSTDVCATGGLTKMDTLTATLTGDETNQAVTGTLYDSVTVNACFSAQ